MKVEIDEERIVLVIEDEGPGIPDIDKSHGGRLFNCFGSEVREMGFGAGMGLPNIKKNVDLLNHK
jgi:serine/threonine-protein kinase RsbT